jgi:two-component system, NarL family, sensor kinase
MAGSDDRAQEEADAAGLSSVERRLARVRYDLHDGPQQDVHLLALDLGLFREQLLPSIARDPNRDRLLGRLDDLVAQLLALDHNIRRLSTSLESPFLARGALAEALREITDAFALRTGVTPQTQLTGDFVSLSDSQQIALLALIREALSNIRKHADASTVTISISSDGDVSAPRSPMTVADSTRRRRSSERLGRAISASSGCTNGSGCSAVRRRSRAAKAARP